MYHKFRILKGVYWYFENQCDDDSSLSYEAIVEAISEHWAQHIGLFTVTQIYYCTSEIFCCG